jgi:hypothetical protein
MLRRIVNFGLKYLIPEFTIRNFTGGHYEHGGHNGNNPVFDL